MKAANLQMRLGFRCMVGVGSLWMLSTVAAGWFDGIISVAALVLLLRGVAHAHLAHWYTEKAVDSQ